MKMNSEDHYHDQDFMRELECQVCMEYMLPPITFCENGHNICCNCRPKLHKCPTCKKHFLSARNFALENIASRSMYPCTYYRSGCTELFPMDLIHGHQAECIYGQYKCPFYREACPWVGSLQEMKLHFTSSHSDRIYKPISETGELCLRLLNVHPTTKYNSIVFALNECFFRRFEVRENCFYFSLQYIGPKKDASKFKYKFCVSNSDDTKRVEVTEVTRSIFEDLDNIYKRRNCVVILYDVIREFTSENSNLATDVFLSSI